MEPTAQQRLRPRVVILRLFVDEAGLLRGRLDDPATEIHTTFAGSDELLALVVAIARNPLPRE